MAVDISRYTRMSPIISLHLPGEENTQGKRHSLLDIL